MADDIIDLPSYTRDPYLAGTPGRYRGTETEEEESPCRAFGYLRGIQDKAVAVRFMFRDGSCICLPYASLGPWEYRPSAGLLAKFAGKLAVLVLLRGSNLDAEIGDAAVNLTDRDLQRHRITWVREMDKDELRRAGEGEPTVDRIDTAAFGSQEKLREWVGKHASAFLGGPLVAL